MISLSKFTHYDMFLSSFGSLNRESTYTLLEVIFLYTLL